MSISCSARKPWEFHISDWLDFEKSHAKIHSNFEFEYSDVDYVFGQTEEASPLWGGRIGTRSSLTRVDVYWLYDKGIGLKLPLSNKIFNDDVYKDSKSLLSNYHREGNSILVATHKLAERVRQDFPKYEIEISAVVDIKTEAQLVKATESKLFDTIVLPICMNDDIDFLKNIKDKDQIRLFMNAECSYTCPHKVCYGTISQINNGRLESVDENGHTLMKCSHWDLGMPRTFYDDDVDWANFYFDKSKFDALGFSKYKLVPSWASTQRTNIMYKDPNNVLYVQQGK